MPSDVPPINSPDPTLVIPITRVPKPKPRPAPPELDPLDVALDSAADVMQHYSGVVEMASFSGRAKGIACLLEAAESAGRLGEVDIKEKLIKAVRDELFDDPEDEIEAVFTGEPDKDA